MKSLWIFSQANSTGFVPSGVYVCSQCGQELFSSMSKFEHSSPWPAFSETIHEDSVTKHPEAWGPIKVNSTAGCCVLPLSQYLCKSNICSLFYHNRVDLNIPGFLW